MVQKRVRGLDNGVKSIVKITRSLIDAKNNGSILLIITGGSCSGKSLLALMIEEALKKIGLGASTLGLDDYYKNANDSTLPRDSFGRLIFDWPDSYLRAEFHQAVESLLNGSNIKSPIYDKKTSERVVHRHFLVKAKPVIIAEGLFAIKFLAGLRKKNVLNIFIEARTDICNQRRVERDTGHLHPTKKETEKFIKERVAPYYEGYVKPQLAQADMVIVND